MLARLQRNLFLAVFPAALLYNTAFAARKLPANLQVCSRSDPNFNDCALKNGNEIIPMLAPGDPVNDIPQFEPLHVEEVSIEDSGPDLKVAVKLKMKDVSFVGLSATTLTSFNADLENGMVSWQGVVPRLEMTGLYDIQGRILVLPITGNGPMNITLEDLNFGYSFKADRAMRDGQEFLDISDPRLTFNPSRARVKLDNLFNGDKLLGDTTNLFLNENWRELVKDIGIPLSEVLNRATTRVFRQITADVPYDDIFTP